MIWNLIILSSINCKRVMINSKENILDNNKLDISLCMIVKNEEDNLKRCLDSVSNFIEEIIIVDTGSSDDTINIAKKYGATVIYYPWNDNFSDPRNESLKYATKKWILVLDADEEITKETGRGLAELSEREDVEAFNFNILNYITAENYKLMNIHSNLKMFRNGRDYFYSGRVHELISPSILKINKNANIESSNLSILHYGYMVETRTKNLKSQRNIDLLHKELEDNPHDSFTNFNLGNSYYVLAKYKEAEKHFQESIKFSNIKMDFSALLFRNYCLCLVELGKYQVALNFCDYAITFYEDYPDLYFIRGEIFNVIGDLDQAESNFLKCTYFKKELVKYVTMNEISGYVSYERLMDILKREGKVKEAIKYCSLMLEDNFSMDILITLYDLLRKIGYSVSQIVEYLNNNFKLTKEEIIKMLNIKGKEFENKKMYEKAFENYIKAVEINHEDKANKVAAIKQVINIYKNFITNKIKEDKNNKVLNKKIFEIATLAKSLDVYEASERI